ncbi:hypothetical protein KIL84_002393 [Mauremys mutica]|uniref:Uncharacterized protein n=1 Tax=Mauremys mutica TaxID=74926 RepID=A0A9D3X2G1_9SAUR|nr:hypothetical protein KIL84_002393 [Mauremys mutica]
MMHIRVKCQSARYCLHEVSCQWDLVALCTLSQDLQPTLSSPKTKKLQGSCGVFAQDFNFRLFLQNVRKCGRKEEEPHRMSVNAFRIHWPSLLHALQKEVNTHHTAKYTCFLNFPGTQCVRVCLFVLLHGGFAMQLVYVKLFSQIHRCKSGVTPLQSIQLLVEVIWSYTYLTESKFWSLMFAKFFMILGER